MMPMSNDLTSPRQYFEADVRPAVQQFLADPGVPWKARCAAVALTSLIEWIVEYQRHLDYNTSVITFREEMFGCCDAIRLVRDVADGARHRLLDRDMKNRIVTTATGAFIEARTLLVDAPKTAYHQRAFNKIASEVLEFWDRWISRSFP
jgi:hypothetical protein